jgi:hypothetical protein
MAVISPSGHCALRAPTLFLARMKSVSAPKTGLWIKAKAILGFIQDRRLRADRFIVRTQSAIRADGPPSAQALAPQFDLSCCAGQYRNSPNMGARVKASRTETNAAGLSAAAAFVQWKA